MQMEALFSVALGLQSPWEVKRVSFSGEPKRLELDLDFREGARWNCPECAQSGCPTHDTVIKEWQHLNFFEHTTLLRARVPRVDCPTCGVKQAKVPWGRPGSGFTMLLEAYLLLLIQSGMAVSKVARVAGVNDNRVWRMLFRYVKEGLGREDLSGLRIIGVDETSRRKGHSYITVVMDLSGQRRRVVFVVEGKSHEALLAFARHLQEHKGDPALIQEVCQDLSAAFEKGVREAFPGAHLTFDAFHVIALANAALDEVRRAERGEVPELKGRRWSLLKNPENWTDEDQAGMDEVIRCAKKTGRAWALRMALQEVYQAADREQGEAWLRDWCSWAQRCRLPAFQRLARTLKQHWDGILRWFDTALTNGTVEAINGLIQATKRVARGFRNTEYLIAMIYLRLGKLDLGLPLAHTK